MNKILFIISSLAVITIACNTTSPDTREGQRIGTWMVYNTEAEWIGTESQSKAKGDTTFLNHPDGKNFYMVDRGYEVRFFLEDSSYTNQDSFHAQLYNPLTPNIGYGYGPRSDHIQFYGDVPVHCDSTYDSNENVVITYWERAGTDGNQERGDTLQIIELGTSGIVDAAKSIHCN